MKILQVAHSLSSTTNGVVAYLYQISKELSRRGHEIVICASDFDSNLEFINSLSHVKIYTFRTSFSVANFYVTLGMISRLKEEIKDFDLIHMHNYRTFQNVLAHHYAQKYGIPYVLQAHGSLPRATDRRNLKGLFDVLIGNRIVQDAAKVVALSDAEVKRYKNMGVTENKIEIFFNGIDLSEYQDYPPRGNFRQKYSINGNEKLILYLGRIHKTKGLDLLVNAFSGLLRKSNDYMLAIVGPDVGYLTTLKKLVTNLQLSDRVLFTGSISQQQKLEAYIDADVFATCNYTGFPTTFLEACACGLPIVTTEKGDKLDWINNNVGYVVQYNKNSLENALSKILENEKLKKQFGENGKKVVAEQFAWSKIIEQLENIYISIK